MPIIPAETRHLPAVHHLTAHAYTRLVHFGPEDLPDLIADSVCVVGTDAKAGGDAIWGFAAIQLEPRPITLPDLAPNRAYVRAILLAKRRSPSADTVALLTAAVARLRSRQKPGVTTQVILQSQGHWLNAPVTRSGFVLVDEVRYYKYTARETPSAPAPARVRMASPSDLPQLARLDAQTFPALWHMDEGALAGLLFSSRLRIARLGDDEPPVGYAALSLNGNLDGPDEAGSGAFLARLAVHPAVQSRGVGRQLLADSIAYAHSQGRSQVYLNTQVSNRQSQRLYEGMGFRTMNQLFQVYVQDVSG